MWIFHYHQTLDQYLRMEYLHTVTFPCLRAMYICRLLPISLTPLWRPNLHSLDRGARARATLHGYNTEKASRGAPLDGSPGTESTLFLQDRPDTLQNSHMWCRKMEIGLAQEDKRCRGPMPSFKRIMWKGTVVLDFSLALWLDFGGS
jgi:hypothetical protein